MRRWVKIIIPTVLLAGGAILCAIRWQAWFGMPAEPRWTGDTINYVFPSYSEAVLQQSSLAASDSLRSSYHKDNIVVLVLGDIHSKLTEAQYDTLAARVPEANVVAQVGDWLERGQDYYYQLLLREWTSSNLYGLPVITTPGNHEYSKGLIKRVSPTWQKGFPHPLNGPAGVPGESYYVDLPQLRFIVIDTNPLNRLMYLTRTLTWLCEQQKNAEDRFVVVMMHHPVLSPAKGRIHPLIYCTFRYALGQADLVLAGHDHSYMRRTPFVVMNTSGKPKQQRRLDFADATDTIPVYGVLTIEKSKISNLKSKMEFTIHRLSDGVQIDSLYVTHD